MMKVVFSLLITLLSAIYVEAQVKDTIVRKYLVCKEKFIPGRTVILPENKTLIIKKHDGYRARGRFFVLNDSNIFIHNKLSNQNDTFQIKDIKKIRNPNIGRVIMGSYLMLSGCVAYLNGTLLIGNKSKKNAGVTLLGLGTAFTTLGIYVFNGPTYRRVFYNYRIVTTKGYVLKHKHLKKSG